jgi:hypothetical protein
MRRRVAFIEFPIYEQFPLISGYLHGYAQADPVIAREFEFVYYNRQIEKTEYADTLRAINALNADIVCFSCYVWNMGLIKRLVRDLSQERRLRHIILGGHQISHHIDRYVDPSDSKTIVINGQGEVAFKAILQRLAGSNSLLPMQGISFFADGNVCNGGEAQMLTNLDDIPSPFLSGLFDRLMYPTTVFETNRGCPYKCTFCTWGGDTQTVAKFSIDRVKEELLWIATHSVLFIFIADANWGMLSRDVDISEYIARLKRDHGCPWLIYYAAAKNKPKGSLACIEKLHEGGVITSQALGIQSMDRQTLELIDRKNIRNEAFVTMFDELKQRNIDSYCELIWPLPGETIETLKRGFQYLLELGADTIIMYPALLINNSKMTLQAGEFEMETCAGGDWRSELRMVKKTKHASRTDVIEGFWFYYSCFVLANCDHPKAALRYLRSVTGKSYGQIVSEFANYLRSQIATSAYAQFVDAICEHEEHGSLMTIGRLALHLTYESRLAIQLDVANFVLTTQRLEPSRSAVFALLWALSLPRLFADTPESAQALFQVLNDLHCDYGATLCDVSRVRADGDNVAVDVIGGTELWKELLPFFSKSPASGSPRRIEINHPASEFAYDRNDSNRNAVYAHGMIQRLSHIAPSVSIQ